MQLDGGGVDGGQHEAIKRRDGEFDPQFSELVLVNVKEMVVVDVVVSQAVPGALVSFAPG